MKQITGCDVIGRPGQCLTQTELQTLVSLADGQSPDRLATQLGTNSIGLRAIIKQLQLKLDATNHNHLITRGFVTGVLVTRALCLLLAVTFTTDDGQQFPRVRTRIRTTHITRV